MPWLHTMFYAEYQPIHMLNEVGFKLACTMLLLTKDCSPLLLLSTSLQVLSEWNVPEENK